ncbi:hypothetical protein LINGRAPRIM_LOCUS1215 [Linum grandiflorum]
MASYGEAQESNRKELPSILRNKNLYFGCMWNTRIIGIRIEPSTDEIRSLGEETPNIIEKTVFLGKWDIYRDLRLPIGMGMLAMDSKVYMFGGGHVNDRRCVHFQPQEHPHSLETVFEFDIGVLKPNFDNFSISSSLPPLPTEVPLPLVVKHLGEIYVLYGTEMHGYCVPSGKRRESNLEYSFLVLRKRGDGSMQWESLPLPPLPRKLLTRGMSFYGAVGSGLYVKFARWLWCYNTNKGQWGEKGIHGDGERGSLTLSSLSVPTTDAEGRPSYVVIFPSSADMSPTITAALVDGDGRSSRFQVIHEAIGLYEARGLYDHLRNFKLIELEEKDHNNCSSTFALVFAPDVDVIGLTVIRVTLLHSVFQVELHREKRQKLSEDEDDDFLKAEILLNQRYITKGEFDFKASIMDDAFFA